MNSLDNVIENLENIESSGDIDEAINYAKKINAPLLTFGEYKELKNEIYESTYQNIGLITSYLSRDSHLANMRRRRDLSKLTNDILQIQEDYEDDFI